MNIYKYMRKCFENCFVDKLAANSDNYSGNFNYFNINSRYPECTFLQTENNKFLSHLNS